MLPCRWCSIQHIYVYSYATYTHSIHQCTWSKDSICSTSTTSVQKKRITPKINYVVQWSFFLKGDVASLLIWVYSYIHYKTVCPCLALKSLPSHRSEPLPFVTPTATTLSEPKVFHFKRRRRRKISILLFRFNLKRNSSCMHENIHKVSEEGKKEATT